MRKTVQLQGIDDMLAKWICLAVAILFVATVMSSCATSHQITSGGTNQCINVENHGYPVAGTPLKMKPCDPWQNQQWTANNGQLTGVAGFCVDVQGSAAVDGAPIIYVPCNGSPSQNWTIANGTLVGIGGKCIDISGSDGPVNGAPLILAACNGGSTQQWVLH